MRIFKYLTIFGLATQFFSAQTFIAKPYLQIGSKAIPTEMSILWQTPIDNAKWSVEVTPEGGKKQEFGIQKSENMQIGGVTPRTLLTARITNLIEGKNFTYKLLKNNAEVFHFDGKALKSENQPYRFIVFGDIGAGTADAKKLAEIAYLQNPDLAVVPGDIIYENGRVSEYDKFFWPVYNADETTDQGAPLIRKIPFVAATGNHDSEDRNFNEFPDILAYFQFWDQPMNGLDIKENTNLVPPIVIGDSQRKDFERISAGRFPKMGNFSMDYGNAHWLFIDSNSYVDFTDKSLQNWILNDLQNAKTTWKFAVFHHPGFSSAIKHMEQQHTRLLAPILEKGGIDVVFNGHVHNYQRTFPMTFKPEKNGYIVMGGKNGSRQIGRVVPGKWSLDKNFNGKNLTKPKGVIYIVTGAGGQDLYNPEMTELPDTWQKFTDKFLAKSHSLSVVDVDGRSFALKQIDTDGKIIDTFTITK